MSQKESYDWFLKNQDSIVSGHIGQSVVIKDNCVVSYYNSDREALDAMKSEPKGSYIIQKCLTNEQNNLIYYTGRFAF